MLSPSHTRTGVKYQPDLADSTTMVMPQPTNSFHPSLLHPNYNMPMVEYPGPTGPIRVQRGWTAPDMMEAGKQHPSLESGGYRFGEELVSFCKNWTPTSHELRRLLKNRLTNDQFQRIATDLDGDYHQEQSEWGAAGAHESHTRTGVKYQPDLADSTTMVMPQPTNSFHPSLLHPNYNMPMVEYPGPTGPIRVQRGWTAPDMMEAGKQHPSLESGGYRFGEELVSFCKNWTPTSHELRRLLKNRLTNDQFQRIATDLDGDYHQEQSEWGAAGAHERVPGEARCLPHVNVDKHLKGHKDLTQAQVERRRTRTKRDAAMAALERLRASNPQPAMVSRLDLQSEDPGEGPSQPRECRRCRDLRKKNRAGGPGRSAEGSGSPLQEETTPIFLHTPPAAAANLILLLLRAHTPPAAAANLLLLPSPHAPSSRSQLPRSPHAPSSRSQPPPPPSPHAPSSRSQLPPPPRRRSPHAPCSRSHLPPLFPPHLLRRRSPHAPSPPSSRSQPPPPPPSPHAPSSRSRSHSQLPLEPTRPSSRSHPTPPFSEEEEPTRPAAAASSATSSPTSSSSASFSSSSSPEEGEPHAPSPPSSSSNLRKCQRRGG
ncbi:hypothetical protein D9C73_000049 [Collichthys lucidus]|uniref:Uncharacterized protein n=1 Tax=Collichthys lucidus TaxID=240159 RepID=A0A4U5TWU6_COLLU|nr:hypothetical protein D9C73_000049 [Collichthys lucidus]